MSNCGERVGNMQKSIGEFYGGRWEISESRGFRPGGEAARKSRRSLDL
jgi:hypothetical protein